MNKQYVILKIFILLMIISIPINGQTNNIPIIIFDRDQHETAGAISPLNPKVIAATWNDFRSSGTGGYVEPGYAFTTDGGVTWFGQNVLPDVIQDTIKYGFDPSISFNRNGTVFYCYIATALGSNLGAVYVSRKNISDQGWQHTRIGNYITDQDKPFICIDNTGGSRNGYIYVAWTSFTGSQSIRFARSTDGGVSFQESAYTIAEKAGNGPFGTYINPESAGGPGAPYPVVGPNGEVYVVWKEDTQGIEGAKIKIRRSTDGGLTFDSPVELGRYTKNPSGVRIGCLDLRHFPTVAVDQNTGLIYVAYEDYETVYPKLNRTKV